jgi:hypothetical protein
MTTEADLLRECRASGQISDAQWAQHCAERPDLLDTSPAAPAPAPAGIRLTKADTVALWHAIDAQGYAVRAMRDMNREEPGKFTPEEIATEQERLLAAMRALRKVNAIRKQSAPLRGSKEEIPPTGSEACAG